jgi:hypothetical protein
MFALRSVLKWIIQNKRGRCLGPLMNADLADFRCFFAGPNSADQLNQRSSAAKISSLINPKLYSK